MIMYLLTCYRILIIEDISHNKTYALFKLLYIVMDQRSIIFVLRDLTDRKIRPALLFPSIIPPGVSGWRLHVEYAEYQNMLKLAEYHSKVNASNVSVDNVSVVPFRFSLV